MKGAEAEVRFIPLEGLTLGANASYVEAVYKSFPNAPTSQGAVNAAGAPLELPPWNFDINARYEHDLAGGRFGIQADYNYADRIPLSVLGQENSVPDDIERRMRKPVKLVNARIDYKLDDQGLTVALFATNLLNKKYAQNVHPSALGLSESSNGGVLTALVREPRIWGVSLRKSFGDE
jgi:iron complex outermembrane receptor protein